MNDILAWGLEAIRFVQKFSNPPLTLVMRGFTALGTAYFYLLALPFVYWCVDKRRGMRLGLLFFFSVFVNGWLKHATMEPRPYTFDPSLAMAKESSYAFPSGHAQASATFWGSASPLFGAPWGTVLALGLPLLIGLSRVYLGVHFPTDVAAGWAIGAAAVFVERRFGDRLERLIGAQRDQLRLAAVAAVALAMNALDMRDTTVSGLFFGFGAGLVLARRAAPYSTAGSFGQKVLRLIVGSAGTVVLYFGPKLLTATIEPSDAALVVFVRLAIVGFWVALGAPWLFIRLALAEDESAVAAAPGN
ncbi:MAG TPA: phosphatase PAP2 family protein [Rectinemataceae bacterium]|nr:phosphatase PAP2 family protein [Rectinemataceae bacterium]